MDTTISTTLIAITVIIASTIGLCFKTITPDEWLSAIGVAGGGAGIAHVFGIGTTINK